MQLKLSTLLGSALLLAAIPAAHALPLSTGGDQGLAVADTELAELQTNAYFAMAAYEDVSKWSCKNCVGGTAGTKFVSDFSKFLSATRWYVALHEPTQSIILSFRGSTPSDAVTFVTDLNIELTRWPKSVPESKVHEGFVESMLKGVDAAIDTLKQQVASYPDYQIKIVGHSLGGAHAVLAATHISASVPQWVSKLRVFTYGEPRVGNIKFAQYYDSLNIPTRRVVNKNDMVPQIPPKTLGYAHHGSEVWIRPSDGVAITCPGALPKENQSCSDGISTLKWSIPDHLLYWSAASH
ncbi:Alpha/Beta hydrolase protein [Dimargaris cristalligena]|uniref:Alpha/Beta hydrolase protein n=1 Tax=Dimargaris cristalligena TaxID=215637 RepID=A0A4Q0A149_9FUNG|nr:Alpha/Beta hydrolase protein [Dimargaris cristalligena]|eukprot:RKP39785.1 Alpha/Beta hydrolase protein [Dimargaris cristalligena]